MISPEKKEQYLLIIRQIDIYFDRTLNYSGIKEELLKLEDLIEDTKQIPVYMKSALFARINEVRSDLNLKTEGKAYSSFDALVIELFQYLHIRRLPKSSLGERIDAYLYPERFEE